MLIVGSVVILGIFLLVGWLVSVEMFQQRVWRRRVEHGDTAIIAALMEEAMTGWRRARAPKGIEPSIWAGVQGAQLAAVTVDSATITTATEPHFRMEQGTRREVASALDQGMAVAARIVEMVLYDVPSLRLYEARVDVYTTFVEAGGKPVQRPILMVVADRPTAEELSWSTLRPEEIISRFEARYDRGSGNEALPIQLPPIEGDLPPAPVSVADSREEPWDNSAS